MASGQVDKPVKVIVYAMRTLVETTIVHFQVYSHLINCYILTWILWRWTVRTSKVYLV